MDTGRDDQAVSAVILSWRRPDNVRRILDGWRAGGLVDDALVWNNNPDLPFTHDWATVVSSSRDLGLCTRFAAVTLARHRAVLVQDDDLLLPTATLAGLVAAWRRRPRLLHGLHGRAPRADGSYARTVRAPGRAPVVLTRALVTHRDHAARFFAALPAFEDLLRSGAPEGNGEDVVFSYVARRAAGGRRHVLHDLPVEELAAPHPIHGRDWPGHLAHRTRVLDACERWLAAAGPVRPERAVTPGGAPPAARRPGSGSPRTGP